MSSNGTILAAAVATSLLAAVAIPSLSRILSSSDSDVKNDGEDDSIEENGDFIAPEDVIKIFDGLFLEMQSVIAQLSQQVQQIQMTGQTIPEKQLRQLLKAEFERALLERQKAAFAAHGVDEDCLAEATWEFLDSPEEYPKVKKCIERFQKLYENISGESVVGRRPGDRKSKSSDDDQKSKSIVSGKDDGSGKEITKDKLLKAAEVYFDALTEAMKKVVVKFKSDGKDLTDRAVAQQLHMEFASIANEAGEEALEEMGISLSAFRAAVEKFSSNMEVARVLTLLQMKQQEELKKLDVPTM